LADKNAKLKNDKQWTAQDLAKADKQLEEVLNEYTHAVEQAQYWYDNIQWLQKRFPEAEYQDVVGLCKMADRSEYVEEQDYSLNAGRYVGVEIEEDNISKEEFKRRLIAQSKKLNSLNENASEIETQISQTIRKLL